MFNNILIIYSEKLTEKHLNVVEKIREVIEKVFSGKCNVVNAKDLQASVFQNIDLVITAGGDGTFMRAAHFIKDILILGINSESEYSEGALTSIKENELDILREILKDNHKTIKRQRAKIIRNGVVLDKLALNEVYVGSKSQFHTSKYKIKFKNNEEEHRSSGVLVVTGSGSNAWYNSAGGKPFHYEDRRLAFLVREPYFGNIFKPKILNGEIPFGEKIIIESKMHVGGVIAIDSNSNHDFNSGDIVEIEISDEPLNVIVK